LLFRAGLGIINSMNEMNATFLETKQAAMLGNVLRLIPVLLAASVFAPQWLLPAAGMLLLWIPMERAKLPLVGVSYILLQDFTLRNNRIESIAAASLFVMIAGGFLLLYAAKNEKFSRMREMLAPPKALYPALTIGAAVVMTLYQCAGYFATGAQGAGMFALINSYKNLGFHPNWRTVLFSTVMMVVLITWPRKFKRLSKVLPSGFVGIVLVALLNILQYPNAAHTPVVDLPFIRLPISALSMLLIFLAWDEVPWRRLKEVILENSLPQRALLCAVPVLMFCFDLFWVMAGLLIVWEISCLMKYLKKRRAPQPAQITGIHW